MKTSSQNNSKLRRRHKNRNPKGRFIQIPYAVLDDEAYISLGPSAKWLLTDLLRQYNGSNNGSMSTAFKLLKKRGWKSKDTLDKARLSLLESGLVVM